MKLLKVITVVAMSACLSLPVMAHRVEHYEGKSSDTLSDALSNFREYNRILEQHLSGDLTDEDLARVHELTYTLENALEKINEELSDLADVLEEVHVASESYNRDALAEPAKNYLRVIKILEQYSGQ